MTGSLTAYARHRKAAGLPGGSLTAAHKAMNAGRITVSRDGDAYVVDFAEADKQWAENTHPTKGRERKAQPEAPPKAESNSSGSKYNQARAAKMAYEAACAELEYKRGIAMAAKIEELARQREAGTISREYIVERLKLNLENALMVGPEAGAVANRALELLGKEIGMFVDRKRISIGSLADATDEELASLLATVEEPAKPPAVQ